MPSCHIRTLFGTMLAIDDTHNSPSIFPGIQLKMTSEEVAKVALLARLRLTDAEKVKYAEQLSLILEFIAELGETNTEGVEPLAHGVDRTNVFREDKAYPALDREKALANAPKRSAEGFLVPAVLD